MASPSKANVWHLEAALLACLFLTASAAFFPGVDKAGRGGSRSPGVFLSSWFEAAGLLALGARRPGPERQATEVPKPLASSFWAWGSDPDLEIAPGLRTPSWLADTGRDPSCQRVRWV